MNIKLLTIIIPMVILVPCFAQATYSIVGTDQATGQIGGGGTSCVGSLDVYIIYGAAPGVGAVHAQANINEQGRDEAVSMLLNGATPEDVIGYIGSNEFDTGFEQRQYGVVDLQGRAEGFTGSANGNWAGDVQGTVDTYTYSIQGNILTSDNVVDQAEAAFTGSGCDLAERLMLALEAGAENNEGDSRCTISGIPSDSAFIHVDDINGNEFLHLSVTGTAPQSPLVELRAQFNLWRENNACPEQEDTDSTIVSDSDSEEVDTESESEGTDVDTDTIENDTETSTDNADDDDDDNDNNDNNNDDDNNDDDNNDDNNNDDNNDNTDNETSDDFEPQPTQSTGCGCSLSHADSASSLAYLFLKLLGLTA